MAFAVAKPAGHLDGELVQLTPGGPVAARLQKPEQGGGQPHGHTRQWLILDGLVCGGNEVGPLSL